MNTDFRVAIDFFSHHKARKLKKRLGSDGLVALLQLWAYAAKLRPDGDLDGMSEEDIELAADWNGEDGTLVSNLCEIGFIDTDGEDGHFVLHDWLENNSWAVGSESRSDASRLSRMASIYPNEYQKLVDAGFKGISKIDYEKLRISNNPSLIVDELTTKANEHSKTVERSLTNRTTNRRENLSPAPSPSPVLKAEEDSTLTSFECLSPPVGDDSPASSPDGQEREQELPENQEAPLGSNASPPPCPYEQIRDMYHTAFPEHPRVALLSAKRKGAVKARWGDAGKRLRELNRPDSAAERLAYFQRLFNKAAMSDFLTGKRAFRDGSVYLVNFDKLMSPGGFVGVIEGKYDNRPEA